MGDNSEMASGAQLRSIKDNIKKNDEKIDRNNNEVKEDLRLKFDSINMTTIDIQNDILAVREVIIRNLNYQNKCLTSRIGNLERRVIEIEKVLNSNLNF